MEAIDPARAPAVKAVLDGLEKLGASVIFEKPLTSSDTAGSGRVVIPKAIAEQYFPRLEQPNGIPLTAVDTRGREYTFKFRFWINNQSRMYLMEGAGELHRAYEMAVGDVMVFAQKPDGQLVVAGRPPTKNDAIKKPSLKRPSSKPESAAAGAGAARRDSKPRSRPATAGAASGGAGGAAVEKAAGGAAGGGGDTRARKRTRPSGPGMIADVEPAVDGIFRAVPHGLVAAGLPHGGVAVSKNGRWVVSLNLAGEMYQALFDTQEDAQEAYNAAGAMQL